MVVWILCTQGNFGTVLISNRTLMGGVTKDQWSAYVKDIFRICKPDIGWVQMVETNPNFTCDDGSVPEDAAIWEYQRYKYETQEVKRNLHLSPDHLEGRVRDAGFVDIQVKKIRMYIGDWGLCDSKLKAAGRAAAYCFSEVIAPFMESMKNYYPDVYERKEFVKRVRADIANESYHMYTTFHCVIGRKPG